jgi:hypothetical protein
MKNETPKLSKSTYPTSQPSQDEWFRQYGVGSGYIQPTRYYSGNHFDTRVFLGEPRRGSNNLFGKIYSLYKNLTSFTWGI